jgi:septation ring formation regulator EzrA
MKLRNKLFSLCLALLLIIPFAAIPGLAANSAVSIGTPEEFIEFAVNCSLDSWSKGKTVTLTADIDLTGYNNVTIPTFGGNFNGAGYAITGVLITDGGSARGLFRHVQSGATVKSLTVEGVVTPEGEATEVGGIVGVNAGNIQECTFIGTVDGVTNVGGVAGLNEESGNITQCGAGGTVDGTSIVGGIVGENLGTVTGAQNDGDVCTLSADRGITDIGGVAGHSAGSIANSINNGVVGMLHTGYNIGGIVGRQDGNVNNCVNAGSVYGRKDVGGIAGELEPYINIVLTDDLLEKLNTELNTLHDSIKDTLTDTSSMNTNVQKHLENASKYIETASSNTNSLLKELSEAISINDSNMDSATALVYSSLGNYSGTVSDMQDAVDKLDDAVDSLTAILNTLASLSGTGVKSVSDAQKAVKTLDGEMENMDKALGDIDTKITSLRSAVRAGNTSDMNTALTDISSSLTALGDSYENCSKALVDFKTAIAGLMSSDSTNQKNAQDALDTLATALEDMGKGADAISAAVKNTPVRAEADISSLKSSLTAMASGTDTMITAADKAEAALDTIGKALGNFKPSLSSLNDPVSKLKTAAEDGEAAFKTTSSDLVKIKAYMTDLSNSNSSSGSSSTLSLSDNSTSKSLYKAIVNLSSEITGLNKDMTSGNKTYSDNMTEVNDQLFKVMGLVIEALEDNGTDGNNVTDVSDDSAASTTGGRVASCTNSGTVSGDRDVGGIVGSMQIENELDPESEQNDELPAEDQYEITAVVAGCLNDGEVTGTRSAVGGIVGRMDLGALTDSENYGRVEGLGDYTGGVAGLSETTIKRCYNKSLLSGDRYVGGIVGLANRVDSCYSIVEIEKGNEYVGSVAGSGDVSGELITGNYYLVNSTPAVDGVSYAGIAEPISVEELQGRTVLPSGFATFTVTCIADDEVVDTVTVPYGTKMTEVVLPEVPEKAGHTGLWSPFTTETMVVDQTVYAGYDNWISVVSSDELDEGRAFALAEGKFTRSASLRVYDSVESAPSSNAWAVWDLELYDTGILEDSVTTVKLLNQTETPATVWQFADGEWTQVDAVRSGHYMAVKLTGNTGTFCMRPNYLSFILLIAIAVAALAAVIVIIVLLVRRSQRKHRKRVGGAAHLNNRKQRRVNKAKKKAKKQRKVSPKKAAKQAKKQAERKPKKSGRKQPGDARPDYLGGTAVPTIDGDSAEPTVNEPKPLEESAPVIEAPSVNADTDPDLEPLLPADFALPEEDMPTTELETEAMKRWDEIMGPRQERKLSGREKRAVKKLRKTEAKANKKAEKLAKKLERQNKKKK